MKGSIFQPYVLFLSLSLAADALPNLSHHLLIKTYSASGLVFRSTDGEGCLLASDGDFRVWGTNLRDDAVKFASEALEEGFINHGVPLDEVKELQQTVKELTATALQMDDFPVPEGLPELKITATCNQLQAEMGNAIVQLENDVQGPLYEGQTERRRGYEAAVGRALDLIEDLLVSVYQNCGISEVEVRERFSHLKLKFRHLIFTIANTADNDPFIVERVLFTVTISVLPYPVVLQILHACSFGPAMRPGHGPGGVQWLQQYLSNVVDERAVWKTPLQLAGKRTDRHSIQAIILSWILEIIKDLWFRLLDALFKGDSFF